MLWKKYKSALKRYWLVSFVVGGGTAALTYSMPKDFLGKTNPHYHKASRAIGLLLGATFLPSLVVALTTEELATNEEAIRRLLE